MPVTYWAPRYRTLFHSRNAVRVIWLAQTRLTKIVSNSWVCSLIFRFYEKVNRICHDGEESNFLRKPIWLSLVTHNTYHFSLVSPLVQWISGSWRPSYFSSQRSYPINGKRPCVNSFEHPDSVCVVIEKVQSYSSSSKQYQPRWLFPFSLSQSFCWHRNSFFSAAFYSIVS